MIKTSKFTINVYNSGGNLLKTKEVTPHYKKLGIKLSKESNQCFFRSVLDGKFMLWAEDFDFIRTISMEDSCELIAEGLINDAYSKSYFNKTDCKFDYFRRSIEITVTPEDNYSKLMEAYDNTYDLIKLAPERTRLEYTKRACLQLYIQGGKVVTNIFGNTYWETEVEPVSNEGQLANKYVFGRGPLYQEIHLEGFNYDEFNTSYRCLAGNPIWNAEGKVIVNGNAYKIQSSIVFEKVCSAGDHCQDFSANIYTMSNHTVGGWHKVLDFYDVADYDVYKICMYNSRDGAGTKIYESTYYYANNSDFVLAQGANNFKMVKISQGLPLREPTPAEFYLGANIINYQIWARILCDVDESTTGLELYDLPTDDFVTERLNFKKCRGLTDFENSLYIKLVQSQATTSTPTAYGLNDYNEYFVAPSGISGLHYIPVARSEWANTSIWCQVNDGSGVYEASFEYYISAFYKKIVLKDAYSVGACIKALLHEIDPTILHENTPEYSQWLYGNEGASKNGGCKPFITQKTNILKGEYDQAAQKAEISLKQLMDMLRDCFKCYWFIDNNNRFRIEHISFFNNGLSYSQSGRISLDLVSKNDKFNKKSEVYDQEVITYDKTNFINRYEFSWQDSSTEIFDLTVAIKNKYLKDGKSEAITPDLFSSDIDLMLFCPNDFSKDGFALLMVKNGAVQITQNVYIDEKQFNTQYHLWVQNYEASWPSLFRNYLDDLYGNQIEAKGVPFMYYVQNIRPMISHKVSAQLPYIPNAYGLIRTAIGYGVVESINYDIDRNVVDLELKYKN